MDIQFTPCERSTTDYPVTPISPSVDSPIDDLFESSLPADLSSCENDDHFLSSPGTPPPPAEDYYDSDRNFDMNMYLVYQKSMEAYLDYIEAIEEDAYNAASFVSSSNSPSFTEFSVPSRFSGVVNNTTLVFLSDSDDESVDSDDESSFLIFDEETFTYYETEWINFSRSVYFSSIPLYTRSPSFGLDLVIISSRPLFSSLPPPSLLDQRVICGRRMFWKLCVRFTNLGELLLVPPLSTADFKSYDRIYRPQPSIYDQITRFACLFEIFAGLLLFVRRILGFLHYSFRCIYISSFQQILIAKLRYSSSADVLLSYLQSRVLSQFGVLLPAGFTGVVEQSSSEVWFWF
ncbi:unnamed protein product [Rhizophagus irregularis]|nr:unnamed protein product [Rhizophagus irregularis]